MPNCLKRIATIAVVAMFVIPVFDLKAQTPCAPESISAQIAELVKVYNLQAENSQTPEEAIAAAKGIRDGIEALVKECEKSLGANAPKVKKPGTGAMNDPYAFNYPGDTGEGFTVRVTTFVSNADQQIRRANMFNERPKVNEKYVLVGLEITCLEGGTRTCDTNYLDYSLVGDKGIIYERQFVVFDDLLDVSLLPGATKGGFLPFLILKEDTNLKLIYRANMFRDEVIVFSAQPSPEDGIEITAKQNINVRAKPGTNQPVVGSIPRGSKEVAIGRNKGGDWLQISTGWVFNELVEANGDVSALPITSE